MKSNLFSSDIFRIIIITLLGILLAWLVGSLTVKMELLALVVTIALASGIVYLVLVFKEPKIAFLSYVVYCFIISGLLRNNPQLPFGPVMEALLALSWLAIIFNYPKYNWSNLNNDYCILVLVWFIINILEVLNPADASILGWLNEIRFTALNWLLVAPIAFLLLNRRKDLNIFLAIIISMSVLATCYGLKQLWFGVSVGEQIWLDAGADLTHVLFGQLRVFSMYTDAGQFGASQAHVSLVALVLALGPFKLWKKIALGLAAGILFYGMLISGTRGALFALAAGGFFAIFLTKNFKVLILGTIMCVLFYGFLKYSTIGSGSYQINRLRTAVDPKDASLNVRFNNQKKLRLAMEDLPFGGGVGITGVNGDKYNADKYLSHIPPDSYWVKIWVMYGVVGLVVWFSIVMFILGKCCGIVWNLQDHGLRVKCIALTAGTAGLFFCSYGNEVMNGLPSSMMLYMSWSYVILAPKLDKETDVNKYV
ncbi:O-antigen ligase family protein [Pedobacter aquae]|uniref:O-antigen ligase family protein n=1 Tax=Pedobacter aquae TaxID=2605747 RepID=A0A5C0VHC9_9SPHI|nr:O-antigen ligase family protein [Pedobacter aquae]QEK51223.1 O-antigen ligase family protein [Pedobacter aquae]